MEKFQTESMDPLKKETASFVSQQRQLGIERDQLIAKKAKILAISPTQQQRQQLEAADASLAHRERKLERRREQISQRTENIKNDLQNRFGSMTVRFSEAEERKNIILKGLQAATSSNTPGLWHELRRRGGTAQWSMYCADKTFNPAKPFVIHAAFNPQSPSNVVSLAWGKQDPLPSDPLNDQVTMQFGWQVGDQYQTTLSMTTTTPDGITQNQDIQFKGTVNAEGNDLLIAWRVDKFTLRNQKNPFLATILEKAFQGNTSYLVVSRSGDYKAHRGSDLEDSLMAARPSNLSAQERQAVQQALKTMNLNQMIISMMKSTWENSIKLWDGKVFHRDQPQSFTDETSVDMFGSTRKIPSTGLITFTDRVPCYNGASPLSCVQVRAESLTEITDVQKLAQDIVRTYQNAAPGTPDPGSTLKSMSSHETFVLIAEPTHLRPYASNSEVKTRIILQKGTQEQQVTITIRVNATSQWQLASIPKNDKKN